MIYSSTPPLIQRIDYVRCDNLTYPVQRMPSDGHCLFSALVHQMYGHDIESPAHTAAVWSLRQEVVTHIHEHLSSYWFSLLETTNSLGLAEDVQLRRIHEFLIRMRDDREWGGEETMLAVTRMYNCNVLVYNEAGTRHTIPAPTPSDTTLHIAYRLANPNERTHYDSVLQDLPSSYRNLRQPEDSTTPALSSRFPTSTAHYHPPEPVLAAWQQQQLVAASQISANPLLSASTPPSLVDSAKVLIGNWNVRGCSNPSDQELMDHYFSAQQFLIIALQETRMIGCTINTSNYVWSNVNDDSNLQARIGGGTAIMVHKSVYHSDRFRRISANTCSYLCKIFDVPLLVISTYIRSTNSSSASHSEFAVLHRYLSTLPNNMQRQLVILGDMNAHLGYSDLAADDSQYIGRNLYHPHSNDNGLALRNLLHSFHLRDYVTLSPSDTVHITWTNRRASSQIDHILMSKIPSLAFPVISGTFHPSDISDHKILKCVLKKSKHPPAEPRLQTAAPSAHNSSGRLMLNLELLRSDPESQQKYHAKLQQLLLPSNDCGSETSAARWTRISGALRTAAEHAIPRSSSPKTPRRSRAGRAYYRARQELLADRNNPVLKKQAEAARKEKRLAYQQHFEDKVDAYLTLTARHPPMEQMRQMYRFIKMHTRNRTHRKQRYISMQQWEEKLRTIGQNGSHVPRLSELNAPPLKPPTREEICDILQSLRNNTAP